MNGFLQLWRELLERNSTRRRFLVLPFIAALGCIALILVSDLSAQEVPPPENLTFTTRLDHTAVWVGDQFHYLISVDHPSNYEFVLDNLTKETVNMDPFQEIDVAQN